MRLGAHNSRNARKGVRGRLPTRADEAGRNALHRCTRAPRGVNQSRAGRIPASFMEVIIVENKQQILDLLLKTLQATANAADVSLTYDAKREIVIVKFENDDSRIVNVAMDSGTTMIRNVMANLGC